MGKPERSKPKLPDLPAHKGKIPINAKKIADIKKLIQYIPEEKKEFYHKLFDWPTTESSQPEEDF